jgi:pilus assembly protein CpaB
MVTRAPFQQQEPLISSKLANPNDPNFLAAELPKGMRVVTIQTSETQGVAGFLFPGDHVDVMMTHDVEKPVKGDISGSARTEKSLVTETVLTNVKVMAVDQHSTNLGATDAQGKLLVPRSATLMVSPADAQRLRLAEKLGTLTLALRSLADRDGADPLIVTQPSDVTQYQAAIGNTPNAGPVADVVTVYHGVTRDTTVAGTVMPPPAAATVPPAPRVMQ